MELRLFPTPRMSRIGNMKSATNLQPGDKALTEYNGRGTDIVTITNRKEGISQSNVMFRVSPSLRNCGPHDWIDAAWFRPVGEQ